MEGKEKMEEKSVTLSCADCAQKSCGSLNGQYPAFCITKAMDPALLESSIQEYEAGENKKMMQVAAACEAEYYGKNSRLEDTMEFARRMGYRKLGIATCLGLLSETRTLAQILRKHGFEVFAVGCKAGEYLKVDMDIPEKYTSCGKTICNPILQAKVLNREKTDMNIIMGLCVGHDMLFTKYSEAPVTTLVAKDQVLAHNPVGALYQAKAYYRAKLEPKT